MRDSGWLALLLLCCACGGLDTPKPARPTGVVRAWADVDPGDCVLRGSFNVALAACADRALTLTYGQPFGEATDYAATATVNAPPAVGTFSPYVSKTDQLGIVRVFAANTGQLVLPSSGSAAAGVYFGATCSCSDELANPVGCFVANSVLHVSGNPADTVHYTCEGGQVDLCVGGWDVLFSAIGNQ